ncbi:MAG TPA: hypothetical protein VIC59_12210 [Gemmatimonadota bacterium]
MIRINIVYVESNVVPGFASAMFAPHHYCPFNISLPTEQWTPTRKGRILNQVSKGTEFYLNLVDRPKFVSFIIDSIGESVIECEPIKYESAAESLWVSDALEGIGYEVPTPGSREFVARAVNNDLRQGIADWSVLLFVVDSKVDADGLFADGKGGFSLTTNGPYMVLTWDNGKSAYTINRFNLAFAHELGHLFGAGDEYSSGTVTCSTSDTFGYLNVPNASCNTGGITADISIMGPFTEVTDSLVDMSVSARGAIGWRNPKKIGATDKAVVDVVKTASASLTAYVPDPTSETQPLYTGTGFNQPFPNGGCNSNGNCHEDVSISLVTTCQWRVDEGPWIDGPPADGNYDSESEPCTFMPALALAPGTHKFQMRSKNNYTHFSPIKADFLTISP